MLHKRKPQLVAALALVFALLGICTLYAWSPLPVENDPLVRMPGTQPNQVTLEAPNRCLNCHSGYDQPVEPGFNWQGSMMAQAARDFVFWACMAVAGQDSIWAAGRPNAVDICERCHFPKGWLEGRSDPTNASAMIGADYDGVQCDFCHSMYDPFFETTYQGTREGDDWLNYWDETNASNTPSQAAADAAYAEDSTLSKSITLFNGDAFYGAGSLPFSPAYVESGGGQFFVSSGGEKRASFADANGRHPMIYSRFHKSRYFCGTCHDVSNPVLANLGQDGTQPLTSEAASAYSYYHVERTFSEFMLSDFGQQGGAPGIGPYAPSVFDTSHPNNYIATCQDCHMPDVVGKGAGMKDAVLRPTNSTEHPSSGQPMHDLTGGNAWVSYVLASAVPGSPNYDATNAQLLNQGPAVLTLDLSQGDSFDPVAILAGSARARQQLLQAAAIEDLSYNSGDGSLSFRIQNQTGHKLISGFPEGRRMFVNIKAFAGSNLIHEVNPYDATVSTLKGLPVAYSPNSPPLGPNESYVDELVYEMHPSSTLTGEAETFHFALATGRYKDNRIPPVGFRIDQAISRLSQPVWHGLDAPSYFTSEEYEGGYDKVELDEYGVSIPGADHVQVNLYYQTTSREYIEFLRDEINGTATTLSSPTPSGEPEAYIVQDDPFFAQLKAWGDTIWQLWDHNKNVPGAAPFLMAQAEAVAEPLPEVRLTTATQTVPESIADVTVEVELSETAESPVSIPYTVGGTATGGGVDHNLYDGTFLIPSGSLTASTTFQVIDDGLYEQDETLIITLGAPVNATLSTPNMQTITILDTNDPPVIEFSSATFSAEESQGLTTINVTLTGATTLTATADYATSDGTATAGEDYLAASGTLTFTPGTTSQAFQVAILDNTLHQEDRSFNLTLSSPTSGTLGLSGAVFTILDEDDPPGVSVGEATAYEGDGTMTFPITLSAVSGLDARVDYLTHDGTALAGVDYFTASGTLTIPASTIAGQIEVTLIDNTHDEGSRTFTLDLSNPVNASLDKDQGTGIILDDDGPPEVAFSQAAFTANEASGSAHVTVTLTGNTAATVTVAYATTDSTATEGEDYITASGTLSFPPGTTSQTFNVTILQDDLYEANEAINLTLLSAVGADLGLSSAVLTIKDDDDPPDIAFSGVDYSVAESQGPATVTVTLTGPTALTATVEYATSDGTAIEGKDYVRTSGTLTFTPGVASQTFDVAIMDNALPQPDRTVILALAAPGHATLGSPNPATLTIMDDDTVYKHSIHLPVVLRSQSSHQSAIPSGASEPRDRSRHAR
ncbi:MAG TPA: Calx-beta domain-containing protein [Anaerolineae bacterium]|nr:Calx-beta domain-containing protein [Anaerolineae bacterium]